MQESWVGERQWDTSFPTGGDVFALVLGVIGVVTLGVSFATGTIIAGILGAYFVAIGVWIIAAPARDVRIDLDGRITFTRRRRVLVVERGELQSVTSFPGMNANRIGPMLVKAESGRIRYKPPPGASDELWEAFAKTNPNARLSSPHPLLLRRPGQRS